MERKSVVYPWRCCGRMAFSCFAVMSPCRASIPPSSLLYWIAASWTGASCNASGVTKHFNKASSQPLPPPFLLQTICVTHKHNYGFEIRVLEFSFGCCFLSCRTAKIVRNSFVHVLHAVSRSNVKKYVASFFFTCFARNFFFMFSSWCGCNYSESMSPKAAH